MPAGGLRPGAGRKRGLPARRHLPRNSVSVADIGALAREYTTLALNTLEKIARAGKSEAARVTAATNLLDRGYGKPKQTIDGNISGKILVGWISETLDLEATETLQIDLPENHDANHDGRGNGDTK